MSFSCLLMMLVNQRQNENTASKYFLRLGRRVLEWRDCLDTLPSLFGKKWSDFEATLCSPCLQSFSGCTHDRILCIKDKIAKSSIPKWNHWIGPKIQASAPVPQGFGLQDIWRGKVSRQTAQIFPLPFLIVPSNERKIKAGKSVKEDCW